MPHSLSTKEWDEVAVSLLPDTGKLIQIDAETLREKSPYFRELLSGDCNGSIVIPLPSVELRELKLWKDWLQALRYTPPRAIIAITSAACGYTEPFSVETSNKRS